MKKSILLLLLCWFVAAYAHATNYYVRTDGNNNNNGRSNTPGGAWKSINDALYGYCSWGNGPTGQGIPMLPGDTLFVADGLYQENGYGYGLKIDGINGSDTQRFVLKAINKWGAKLELTSQYNAFNIINSKGITVDGFDIFSPAGSTNIHSGINMNNSEFVTIRNCKLHNFGLGAVGGGTNIIVEYNQVYDNSHRNSGNGSGINFYHPRKVSNNTLAGGWGFIIRGNVVYDNYCQLFYTPIGSSTYGPPTDGNGIIIDDWNFTQDASGTPYKVPCLIENNICFNNGGSGIRVYDSDNVTIRNNTCYNNCWVTAQYDAGNATYPSSDINVTAETGKGNNMTVVNNIAIAKLSLSATHNGIGIGDAITNTSVTNNYTNKLFFPVGPLPTPNVIGSNALFVNASTNPATANFRLTTTSPAINIGLNTNAAATDFDGAPRPIGGTVDAGAFETLCQVNAGTISGITVLCEGATTGLTSNGLTNGSWLSSNAGVATINSSGIVTGVSAGTASISYSVSVNGCSSSIVKNLTINALPNAGTISGNVNVTVGTPSTLTSNGLSTGTWASSHTAIARVSASGVITGVSAGTATISYSVSANGCSSTTTRTFTVSTPPAPVTTVIVVRARSLGAAGSNITIEVMNSSAPTGGVVLQSRSFSNLSTTLANYTFSATGVVGANRIRVRYTNDMSNRDLEIDYITVGGTTYQAEATSTYQIGVWRNVTDGCSVGGYYGSSILQCTGYLHFLANTSGRIASLAETDLAQPMQLYPNPVSDRVNVVVWVTSEQTSKLQVYSLTGLSVMALNQKLSVGRNRISIPVVLNSGVYILSVPHDGKAETAKFVVME